MIPYLLTPRALMVLDLLEVRRGPMRYGRSRCPRCRRLGTTWNSRMVCRNLEGRCPGDGMFVKGRAK